MFDRLKYKNFAKVQLQNRIKIPAIIVLIFTVISYIFSIPERFLPDYSLLFEDYLNTGDIDLIYNSIKSSAVVIVIAFFLNIVLSLINFAFRMGELNVHIKMTRSQAPVTMQDFTEGLKKWGKGIKTGLWVSLWIFIWFLIPLAVWGITIGLLAAMNEANSILMMFIGLISIILIITSLIPCFIKAIQYSQAFYFAAEFNIIGARKALKLSKLITKTHIIDLLVLSLSFLGWAFIEVFTLGIASLWVSPYKSLTNINAFHAMIKEAVAKNEISLDELDIQSNDTLYSLNQIESDKQD